MHDGWREEVLRLKGAKRYDEAAALIRQAIEAGNMAARVMLAKMYDEVGMSRSEANQLIDYVETHMDPTDAEAHYELVWAYDLYMGTCIPEEMPRRKFDHLLKAAEYGGEAIDSLAVARNYREGVVTVEDNEGEAVRWYKRAIELGSVEAAHELQEYYKDMQEYFEKTGGRKYSVTRIRQAIVKGDTAERALADGNDQKGSVIPLKGRRKSKSS